MGGTPSRPAPAPSPNPSSSSSSSGTSSSTSAAAASASAAASSATAAATSAGAASTSANAAALSASQASRYASDASGSNVVSEEVLQERMNTRNRIKEQLFGNNQNPLTPQQKNNLIRILSTPNYSSLRNSLDLALANYQTYLSYNEILINGNDWINSNTPIISYDITNRIYDHLSEVNRILNRDSNRYIKNYLQSIGAFNTDYTTVSIQFMTNYIMTHPATVTPEETATAFLNHLVDYYDIPPGGTTTGGTTTGGTTTGGTTTGGTTTGGTTTESGLESFRNYTKNKSINFDYSKISVDNGSSMWHNRMNGSPFFSL